MIDVLLLLGAGWAACALVMAALWARQRRTLDATLVDVAWAANLGGLALMHAAFGAGAYERRILIAVLAGTATFRLAWHLWVDRGRKQEEDGRYRALRERWGSDAQRKFFWFFQAQGFLDVLLSVPFALAASRTGPLDEWDVVALAMGVGAIFGETTADRQLARFRSDPRHRGRTCRVGLWRYSRHPNYFFQWLLWCAYALLALPADLGWIGALAPALMLFLILRVTGIPPTEERALLSRGDDYRDYQRTTSAFVPWFPKKGFV